MTMDILAAAGIECVEVTSHYTTTHQMPWELKESADAALTALANTAVDRDRKWHAVIEGERATAAECAKQRKRVTELERLVTHQSDIIDEEREAHTDTLRLAIERAEGAEAERDKLRERAWLCDEYEYLAVDGMCHKGGNGPLCPFEPKCHLIDDHKRAEIERLREEVERLKAQHAFDAAQLAEYEAIAHQPEQEADHE